MNGTPEDFKKKIEELLKGNGKPKYQSGDIRGSTPDEVDEDVAFATEKALAELEKIRRAFLDLQDAMKDLAIAEHIKPGIELVGGSLQGLHQLLLDDVDVDKLTTQGRSEYMEAQKIRAQILAHVYKKYKGGKS